MRKSAKIYLLNFLMVGALATIFTVLNNHSAPRAQTVSFQNGNAACEAESVLCTSATPTGCQDAESIACKNFSATADFNGDGFVDCAAANAQFPNTALFDLDISVLINTKNTGPCTGGVLDQFGPSQDYELSYFGSSNFTVQTSLGSIVVGNLNPESSPSFFDDLAVPAAGAFSSSNDMVSAYSVSGGGFGPAGAVAASTSTASWQNVASQFTNASDLAQRNMALLDCDGDTDLDAVVAVEEFRGRSYQLNLMQNDGTGLQDVGPSGSFSTMVLFPNGSPAPVASVAIADFNNNGSPDVAVAVGLITITQAATDRVSICINDGSCGFTCSQQVDVDAAHGGQRVEVSSVVAGDFNNDGNADIAVTEPNLDGSTGNEIGVHFYFGQGNGTFSTPGIHVPFSGTAGCEPRVLTTGFFNNDDTLDVALSCDFTNSDSSSSGEVAVFTFNGSNGFNVKTLSFGSDSVQRQSGLDAANFDQRGCDDIIALARDETKGQRAAFVFLSDVSAMSAIAGADQAAALNVPTVVSTGICAVSPTDPGALLHSSWTISPAVGASLANADTLTPTFTATVPGAYNLTLLCHSRCTADATDTKTVTVVAVVPTPSPTPVPATPTQGSCLASLDGNVDYQTRFCAQWWMLLVILPGAYLGKRLKKIYFSCDR